MIAIIDYGLGNISAFKNLYESIDVPVIVAKSKEDLQNVSKIILPGVGAFDYAMEKLHASGMKETLDYLVLEKKIPVIGICVGMQILAKTSEEGSKEGLGWINAEVRKLPLKPNFPVPHMGWNTVVPANCSSLFNGLEDDSKFYFLHSYYFFCHDSNNSIATSEYGNEFCCAVQSDNIMGVQFHPEKSHSYGVMLLSNFSKI